MGFKQTIYTLAGSAWIVFILAAKTVSAEPEGAFISRMDDLFDPNAWYIANFAIRRDSFRTAWKRTSIERTRDGSISLWLVPAPTESQKDFFGAEVQRSKRTHFGRYEVVMQAARGFGVISSFFTYTGSYFGDPHEEIDFEFLGRDTSKVWLNRFVAGQKLPGRWIPLGFDAADKPHLYTLEWRPDELVWSAEGRELMRVTETEAAIPQIPQRIYLNIWGGGRGQQGWSGEAPSEIHARAVYHCLSYRPPGSEAPMCSDEWPIAAPGDG